MFVRRCDSFHAHLGQVHLGQVHLGHAHLDQVHLDQVHLGQVHLGATGHLGLWVSIALDGLLRLLVAPRGNGSKEIRDVLCDEQKHTSAHSGPHARTDRAPRRGRHAQQPAKGAKVGLVDHAPSMTRIVGDLETARCPLGVVCSGRRRRAGGRKVEHGRLAKVECQTEGEQRGGQEQHGSHEKRDHRRGGGQVGVCLFELRNVLVHGSSELRPLGELVLGAGHIELLSGVVKLLLERSLSLDLLAMEEPQVHGANERLDALSADEVGDVNAQHNTQDDQRRMHDGG